MKTVIHIGSPKTGTTALQRGLYAAREALLAESVLYPFLSAAEVSKNHGPLSMILLRPERLPRIFKSLSEEERQAACDTAIQELAYQISKNNPETLVLSSEYFFRVVPPGRWVDLLKSIPGTDPSNVRICCYVRKPSAHYLSLLQQRLKASFEILPPQPHNFRRVLDSYKEHFPEAEISVRAFERGALVGQDISKDFFASQLTTVSESVADKAKSDEANTSLSAPAMMLLRDFREKFFLYDNDKFMKESKFLIKVLESLDAKMENTRPQLRPEIVDQIDYGGSDLVWLRDAHGISFTGYDFDRAGTISRREEEQVITSLRNLLIIDDAALNRLILRVRKRKFIQADERFIKWIDDLAERQAEL
ncbi:hypothetical protein FTO60_10005 [Octadecabacter sp. SW4]|uniref:hypothetical protein n=1 Tax=Octadecabacter sp. SW4 TaxID=2602067 RepID=UPI0011C1D33B|nr:hypothetical protein [Octadecabacter sp. SW4]QEE36015.1 hypothetical protein FTO60_10005 [Octadecabacter sp. SW4]